MSLVSAPGARKVEAREWVHRSPAEKGAYVLVSCGDTLRLFALLVAELEADGYLLDRRDRLTTPIDQGDE